MAIDLQDFRDVTIIIFTIAGTVLFVIGTVLAVVIGGMTFFTVRKVRSVLNDGIQPTLENVRETTENVRGTVAFISDHAVTPGQAVVFYEGDRVIGGGTIVRRDPSTSSGGAAQRISACGQPVEP